MTQFAAPNGDDFINDFSAVGGSGSIWDCLDEVTANDSDLARSGSLSNGNSASFRVVLVDVTDPQVSTSHTVWVRARHTGTLQGSEITVHVKEGTTTIGSPIFQQGLTNSFQTFSGTLSGAQADNITDYSNLRLEVVWTKNTGLGSTQGEVSWLNLQIPDAPVLSATPSALLLG